MKELKCYRCNDWPCTCRDGQTIIHGDCREVLPLLDPVDLVLTDPPYGVNYRGGHFHSGDVNIKRERAPIACDDGDVYDWLMPTVLQLSRGPCYVFFADTRAATIYNAVEKSGGVVHALIVWHKTNATYAAMNAQYKQRHEPLLYCKGKNAKTNWCGPSSECTVWDMQREASNGLHPTQKPVWLFSRAISNHEADVVLDPFMGSGTTLIAAKDNQRHGIGIELEERYCEIAANRLRQEVLF